MASQMFDSKLNLHCCSQIDNFCFQFKFNNHKIVQYENKNLSYTNVYADNIIYAYNKYFGRATILKIAFFRVSFHRTNRPRTDNEKERQRQQCC